MVRIEKIAAYCNYFLKQKRKKQKFHLIVLLLKVWHIYGVLHNFHFKSHHSYLLSTTCYNLLKNRVIIFVYISKKEKEKRRKERMNQKFHHILLLLKVWHIYGMLHNFHFKSYHSYFIRKKKERVIILIY